MSFKKYIGIEIELPNDFQEHEDTFMVQLLSQLNSDFGGRTLTFRLSGVDYRQSLHGTLTGKFEFIDPLKGF